MIDGRIAMPKKGKDKEEKKGGDDANDDLAENVSLLVDNLIGNQTLAKQQLTLTRPEAGYYIWRHCIISEPKRQEIAKGGAIPWMFHLVKEEDNQFGNLVGVGCLQFLASSEEVKPLVLGEGPTAGKNLASLIALLGREHDRTRLRVASLLYSLAQQPEVAFRLRDFVPDLLPCLGMTEHKWADTEEMRALITGCLRCLAAVEFIPETTSFRAEDAAVIRDNMVSGGVIPPIVHVLKTGISQGQMEAVGTLALLLEQDGVPAMLMQLDAVPQLVKLCADHHEETRAHAAACLMLLAVEPEYISRIRDAGAIPPLINLLVPPAAPAGATKKKKNKKKAPPLPPAIDLAIQNASGALMHLTYDDKGATLIADADAIPLLVPLLDSKNIITFQNSTGALYNIAMDPSNYEKLVAAKAPKYLQQPLHARWLTVNRNTTEEVEEENDGGGGGMFLTQGDFSGMLPNIA
ncbi:hypothetical protein CYMTET_38881 [Cymbomonas tetramitiformis]|uniref:Uncharacterized protein n=1 Tax=Cymbomonas tetramitiformis TaxID=36881 RepID=A0AAE0CB64_9CHLO|nr:hypothetical protein CYMTET_38881 [Cymbomonas tetramitiformis]